MSGGERRGGEERCGEGRWGGEGVRRGEAFTLGGVC